MWGALTAGAQPWIASAWGATSHNRKGVNRGSTGTGTGTLRKRCARLQTLGFRTLGELLSLRLMAVLEGSGLAKSRTCPRLVDACTRRLDSNPPVIGIHTHRGPDALKKPSL
jgi:hypothetical protein